MSVIINNKEYEYIDDVILPILKHSNGCDHHRIEIPFGSLGISPQLKYMWESTYQAYLKFKVDMENKGQQYSIVASYFQLLDDSNSKITPKVRTQIEEMLGNIEAITFNRDCGLAPDTLIEKRKKYGFRIIFDIDDYWVLNDDHILSDAWKKGNVQTHMQKMLSLADAVTVTTERLRQRVLSFNKNCYVIPNALPLKRKVEEIDWKNIRFGYVAGSTHGPDVKHISNVFSRVKGIDFALCGYDDKISDVIRGRLIDATQQAIRNYHKMRNKPRGGPQRPILHGMTIDSQYNLVPVDQRVKVPAWEEMEATCKLYTKYRRVNTKDLYTYMEHYGEMEVCIAPLAPNEFNKYKSSLKCYEAASMGNAFIGQRYPPFSDDLDGVTTLCETDQEWIEAIRSHQDPGYAQEQAQKLQEWFSENRSIEAVNRTRLAAYEKILTRPVKKD